MSEFLEQELKTYEKVLPSLLGQAGHYCLIQGDRLIDVYAAYEDALKEGYQRFGLETFLVKQIEATQSIHFFSRDLVSCPA